MVGKDLDVLIIVGSPNENGKSAHLAESVSNRLKDHGIDSSVWPLATYPVAACRNCGACQRTGECSIMGDPWPVLQRHMESADLVFLVAPVYFAGPAAHLKAMLDRCQVFWARKYRLDAQVPPKRPVHLLVVGDGGDPFGYDPLVSICTSALNCANLRVDGNVHAFVGDGYQIARVPALVDDALAGIGWLAGEGA